MNINNTGNHPGKFIVTIIMLLCISLPATTSADSLVFKIVKFVLNEEKENQMPSLFPLVYEPNSTIAIGAEFELNWDESVTGGAEQVYYKHDWVSLILAASGETENLALLWNLKYYFNPDTKLRPYLGIGAGVRTITHTLDTTGDSSTGNMVFQGIAGIRYQFSEKIGIFGEYKQTAGPSDTLVSGVASVDIAPDADGSAIFVGVSLNL